MRQLYLSLIYHLCFLSALSCPPPSTPSPTPSPSPSPSGPSSPAFLSTILTLLPRTLRYTSHSLLTLNLTLSVYADATHSTSQPHPHPILNFYHQHTTPRIARTHPDTLASLLRAGAGTGEQRAEWIRAVLVGRGRRSAEPSPHLLIMSNPMRALTLVREEQHRRLRHPDARALPLPAEPATVLAQYHDIVRAGLALTFPSSSSSPCHTPSFSPPLSPFPSIGPSPSSCPSSPPPLLSFTPSAYPATFELLFRCTRAAYDTATTYAVWAHLLRISPRPPHPLPTAFFLSLCDSSTSFSDVVDAFTFLTQSSHSSAFPLTRDVRTALLLSFLRATATPSTVSTSSPSLSSLMPEVLESLRRDAFILLDMQPLPPPPSKRTVPPPPHSDVSSPPPSPHPPPFSSSPLSAWEEEALMEWVEGLHQLLRRRDVARLTRGDGHNPPPRVFGERALPTLALASLHLPRFPLLPRSRRRSTDTR